MEVMADRLSPRRPTFKVGGRQMRFEVIRIERDFHFLWTQNYELGR